MNQHNLSLHFRVHAIICETNSTNFYQMALIRQQETNEFRYFITYYLSLTDLVRALHC